MNIIDGVIVIVCFLVVAVIGTICSWVYDKVLDYKMIINEQEWIPCDYKTPTTEGIYLTTVKVLGNQKDVKMSYFTGEKFIDCTVIAWKKKPKAYEED